MADEVYRIVTEEGHEYDYHGGTEQLKKDHPGAVITGKRVENELGEGSYEPYTMSKAQSAERKAAAGEEAPVSDEKTTDDAAATEDDGATPTTTTTAPPKKAAK